MPYRRLPNTDQARLRSLQAAVDEGEKVGFLNLPFSYKLQNEAVILLNQMEQSMHAYQIALDAQVASSKKYVSDLKMARLYVSHFIQVLNMSVQRGEIKSAMRDLYGLPTDNNAVPDLSTEDSVVLWGGRIIRGEELRVKKGGIPIYNPSIGKVKAYYDIFMESKISQKVLQSNTRRAMTRLDQLHETSDPLIQEIWNQVENCYKDLPAEERRAQCRRFGVCYYFRKGEKPSAE